MQKTLQEILIDVNSYVDLEATLPVDTELETRTNYANQVVWDAAAVAQLSEFDTEYHVDPSTNYIIPLPEGFKEFKGSPKQYVNGTWVEYPEVLPQERYNKEPSDKYCYVTGNPAIGFSAVFNAIEASCTLSILYQSFPTGFITLTSKCELRDPTYVVAGIESYVLQARGDDRFPFVDAVREKKLKNLIGASMKSPGGQVRVAPSGFKNPLNY